MTLLIYFGLLLLLAVFMLLGYYYIDKYHAKIIKRAEDYDRNYLFIEDMIERMDITPQNHDLIYSMLSLLCEMDYKNEEKIEVLANKFFIRFYNAKL